MSSFYSKESNFYIALDCIIFGFDQDKLKLLLLKRRFNPAIGQWSLAGGFLKPSESLDFAAKRILYELTGLNEVYLEQLATYGEINRDPGERVVSVAYCALIKITDYDKELINQNNASWISINEIPSLIFDHQQMVNDALLYLQQKAFLKPIVFELLPQKFTLLQLQQVYESIYQKKIDKRNFIKKILSLRILNKFNEKEKKSSRKGAFLYSFDNFLYKKREKLGIQFIFN